MGSPLAPSWPPPPRYPVTPGCRAGQLQGWPWPWSPCCQMPGQECLGHFLGNGSPERTKLPSKPKVGLETLSAARTGT